MASPYRTDSNIILKYKSNRGVSAEERTPFQEVQFVYNILFLNL